MCSSVCSAEETEGEHSPSLTELEQFAQLPDAEIEQEIARGEAKLEAGKPYTADEIVKSLSSQTLTDQQAARVENLSQKVDQAIKGKKAEMVQQRLGITAAEMEKAQDMVQRLSERWKIEKQIRAARAKELADEVAHLLYYENKPDKAYELALKALSYDSANQQAQKVRGDAGLQKGIPGEVARFEAKKVKELPGIRVKSARQMLENAVASASQLHKEGKYEQAIKQLHTAQMITESLAAHMDVDQRRREVQNMLDLVEHDYDIAQKKHAAEQKVEAAGQAKQWAVKLTEEERKKKARRVEDIRRLIDQKEFDAAEIALLDMGMEDPSDTLVLRLRQQLSQASRDYKIMRANAARIRGDDTFDIQHAEREAVPERLYNYPDKRIWKDVIEKREQVLYPTAPAEVAEENRPVRDALAKVYDFPFEKTSLPEVVSYLGEVTDVTYMLFEDDLTTITTALQATGKKPPEITYMMKSSLEEALDRIMEQANQGLSDQNQLDWQVEDGMIKIGFAERLRHYEVRIYPVMDLLLDLENTGGGGGGRGGRGGSSRRSAGGYSDVGGYSSGGCDYDMPQFIDDESGISAQFGGTSNRDNRSNRSNRRNRNNRGNGDMSERAESLITLIKVICSPETWATQGAGTAVNMGSLDGGDRAGGARGSRTSGGRTGGYGGTGGFGLPQFIGDQSETSAQFGAVGGMGGMGGIGGPSRTPSPFGMGGAGGFGGFPGAMGPGGPMAQGGVQGGALVIPRGEIYMLPAKPGNLIVYQTAEVHECIADLLKQLRETMNIQIHIEVRVLDVNTDFMREVGFRWDHFMLSKNRYTGPWNSLQGFTVGGGALGPPPTPFLSPNIVGSQYVNTADPGEDPVFEWQPVYGPQYTGLRWPWGDVGAEVDPDTGQITFDPADLALTGAPFIDTGLPFFDQTNGLNLNFGYGGDPFTFAGFFRLAHAKNASRTITAGNIMLMNGQESTFSSSTDQDYVATYSNDDGYLVPEVDTATSGINLTVRPVASADLRYVFMELDPSINNTNVTNFVTYQTAGSGGGGEGGEAAIPMTEKIYLPVETSDSVPTTVGAPDRGVVVLGGMSTSSRTRKESGVPVLDKIPLLKRLFGAEGQQLTRYTHFWLVRPQILLLSEEEQRMK